MHNHVILYYDCISACFPGMRSPWTVHGRIIGPPGPNIAAIPGPPLRPTVPHAADCGLFAIAFTTALAYGEQPGHCPFNQNKVRQHQLKPLQDGEMTPLPLKKNRRNGRRVKTWNTIQVRCTCRMLNDLGTSIMHDWPSIRVRETPIYASLLHS